MIGVALCLVAFVATFVIARKSLVLGIVAAIAFGYGYGILRANFFDTGSHFIFDAAVLGLYVARVGDINRSFASAGGRHFKHWVTLLLAIPLVLFFVPMQDFLVQLVGLRANAYLLPFLLIGAILRREDWYRLALWVAGLNLIAFLFGGAEYLLGVQRFFPYNAVTEIIYRSGDVGFAHNLRIPSLFGSAHVYGGTMVLTVPVLTSAWMQRRREIRQKTLLIGGLIAAILGVFMSAARLHFVVLALLLMVAMLSTRVRPIYRVGWVMLLLVAGYVVSTQDRMQRFTTLGDIQYLQDRIDASLNTTLFDAMIEYPFGNGLGAGGTSIPFFLADRVHAPVAVESEWGRIELETGWIGLVAWCAFLLWVFTRSQPHRDDPGFLGWRLTWIAALYYFASSFIGIGLFTAIPQAALLFMLVGWIATHRAEQGDRIMHVHPPKMRPVSVGTPHRELVRR